MRFFNQLLANTLALVRGIYRKIGKIRDISKICKASGYANETSLVPRRDDEIGMLEHLLKDFRTMNRPSFSQSGAIVEGNHFLY